MYRETFGELNFVNINTPCIGVPIGIRKISMEIPNKRLDDE